MCQPATLEDKAAYPEDGPTGVYVRHEKAGMRPKANEWKQSNLCRNCQRGHRRSRGEAMEKNLRCRMLDRGSAPATAWCWNRQLHLVLATCFVYPLKIHFFLSRSTSKGKANYISPNIRFICEHCSSTSHLDCLLELKLKQFMISSTIKVQFSCSGVHK